jgi:hypothetical protein
MIEPLEILNLLVSIVDDYFQLNSVTYYLIICCNF